MKEIKVKKSSAESVEYNVCNWHNCIDCYYFDSSYHGGYCDKHKVDTNPGNSCGGYVSK